MSQPNTEASRLAHLPISFFAMVMGLAGLTIGWQKAQHVFQTKLPINTWLTAVTATTFAALLLLYLAKLLMHRQAVLAELHHPVKLNFFPTISISLLLLSIAFLPVSPDFAQLLWLLGAGLHLLITLYVVNVWMHHDHLQINHINPAWFIPAVGNVLVPVAGVPLGFIDVSWFFFSVGMLFWVMLMTIIFYRILFHHPLDEKLLPTLFILIAPPAVGFIAYTRLAGDLDTFARFLYFAGLFLTLQMITQSGRFKKLPFFLSWWAYSFPLAAISIASMVMFDLTGKAAYRWLGAALLIVLTAIVGILLVRTGNAVRQHKICVAEH